MAFFGYPHAPRATAQRIHLRSTTIVQSVSGDARDVPLTTEFLGWSYGLGARERQSCPFFGKDARFTALAQAARRSISATMLAGHINWPSWSVPFYLLCLLLDVKSTECLRKKEAIMQSSNECWELHMFDYMRPCCADCRKLLLKSSVLLPVTLMTSRLQKPSETLSWRRRLSTKKFTPRRPRLIWHTVFR